MATKNEMIMASQDLQTVFGLEPPLNMQGTWQELLAGLLEFKAEMTPQEVNQMKPGTYKLLQALNVETKPPVAKKPPAAKKPVEKVEAPDFREPEKVEEVKPVVIVQKQEQVVTKIKPVKTTPAKPVKAKAPKPAPVTTSSRTTAILDVLIATKQPVKEQEFIAQAEAAYVARGGTPNPTQTKRYWKRLKLALEYLGFVQVQGGVISVALEMSVNSKEKK